MQTDQPNTQERNSLLSCVNWRALGRQTAKELSNREIHYPVVSAYRWWARRPHSVMGAILDAAIQRYGDQLTVADPFSGGGTVTFEAARRGLKAYAQDLYPWPARGLASALSSCTAAELNLAADKVLSSLAPFREQFRTTSGAELSHILRVRVAQCQECKEKVFEFPHVLVSVASRRSSESDAFFGCRACGEVSKRRRDVETFTCDSCGERWHTAQDATGCSHCACKQLHVESWHAVLVQELVQVGGRWKAVLRKVRDGDPVPFEPGTSTQTLLEPISAGKETKRLIDNGFTRWGDLYTSRQVDLLRTGLQKIRSLEASSAVQDRLAFCFLGAAEMPAFLSRWDRFHLKPFEGMANHRYTQTTLAVESNLLSPTGRGTLPRRLKKAAGVLEWLIQSQESLPKVVEAEVGRRGRKRTDWDVMVITGSSVKQALRDASVSVVITDPPYLDDVQYGELARLFHAWLRVYDPSVVIDESEEAVPNARRGTSVMDYENTIAACLRESRRTLIPDGKLVLTFHNKKLVAWRALAGAIYKAGFEVSALASIIAENGADHCKRNVTAMLHDLVIECTPLQPGVARIAQLEFRPRSVPEKNLAAIGLALAECVQTGRPDELGAIYQQKLTALSGKSRLIE